MARTLKEAEDIIKELSTSDRQILLQRLIDEADPVDVEIEKAWLQESKIRLDAMRDGRLDLIDEDQAFLIAEASLDEKV